MTYNELVPFFVLFKIRPNITDLSFWRSYWPEDKWVTIKRSFLASASHRWVSPTSTMNKIAGIPSPLQSFQHIISPTYFGSLFCSLGLGSSVFPAAMCWGCLSYGFMGLIPLLMPWGMAPCPVVLRPHLSLQWASRINSNGKTPFPLTHATLCYMDFRAGCSVLSKA